MTERRLCLSGTGVAGELVRQVEKSCPVEESS